MENPVVNFQMPYEDAIRVQEFYSKAFGWNMINTGEATHNYIAALTTESEGMESVTPSAINGGFSPKSQYNEAPCLVISVKDIEKALKAVQEAGGTILGKPMDIPQVGKMASVLDSEGNKLSLLQH